MARITRVDGERTWEGGAPAAAINRALGEIEAALLDLEAAVGRQGERLDEACGRDRLLAARLSVLEGKRLLEPEADQRRAEGNPSSLLPCPFCGGEAVTTAWDMLPAADVRCPSCRALVSGWTLGEARDKWNRRS